MAKIPKVLQAGQPHCDGLMLHAPGVCQFCDDFPDRQKHRIDNKINFTGEFDPCKEMDPCVERRDLEIAERWHGNRVEPSNGTK